MFKWKRLKLSINIESDNIKSHMDCFHKINFKKFEIFELKNQNGHLGNLKNLMMGPYLIPDNSTELVTIENDDQRSVSSSLD